MRTGVSNLIFFRFYRCLKIYVEKDYTISAHTACYLPLTTPLIYQHKNICVRATLFQGGVNTVCNADYTLVASVPNFRNVVGKTEFKSETGLVGRPIENCE